MDEKRYNLEFVALHATPVCSLGCPFCYEGKNHRKASHPNLENLVRVIDELHKENVTEIFLFGGDPGAYPSLMTLAKYITSLKMRLSIFSNTLQFVEDNDAQALENFASIESTICAHTAELHDQYCQVPGAYERLLKNLGIASKSGRDISISVHITPESSSRIFEIIESLIELHRIHIKQVTIRRIIPFGMARHSNRFQLERRHVEEAFRSIRRVDDDLGITVCVDDPFPMCILPKESKKYIKPCQWGYTKGAVNEFGMVSRCCADPRYRLGNIFERPLHEIWNESPVLRSFRSRAYLPRRCQVCADLEQCGGGCPLGCEIQKDHGADYLYDDYDGLDAETTGAPLFRNAGTKELSGILRLEWSNFTNFQHILTVDSIQFWYRHNPAMFYIVLDESDLVLGYSVLCPITQTLHRRICNGEVSSLCEFPAEDVCKNISDFYHLEAIGTAPSRTASIAGRLLVKGTASLLLNRAKFVTAVPITAIGSRLCRYFEFRRTCGSEDIRHPAYRLEVNRKFLESKIRKL